MVEYKLQEDLLFDENFPANLTEILKAAHPLNVFLNYTVDEVA